MNKQQDILLGIIIILLSVFIGFLINQYKQNTEIKNSLERLQSNLGNIDTCLQE